jgi:hypothetical protein
MLHRLCGASIAGLICLFAAWAGSNPEPVQDPPGILALSIVDETTAQPTPARVEVLDKDGKGYEAEDALLIGGD